MTDLEYLCTVFDTMSLSSLNGEIKNVESVTEGHKLICVKVRLLKFLFGVLNNFYYFAF